MDHILETLSHFKILSLCIENIYDSINYLSLYSYDEILSNIDKEPLDKYVKASKELTRKCISPELLEGILNDLLYKTNIITGYLQNLEMPPEKKKKDTTNSQRKNEQDKKPLSVSKGIRKQIKNNKA